MSEMTCCEMSRERNEPLYGTMKPKHVYFLLEYNPAWPHEAVDKIVGGADSPISEAVKAHFEAIPNSKILLIRQPGQRDETDAQITLFIVDAHRDAPRHYKFYLANYDAVLDLDLNAILAGEAAAPYERPVYAVCVNGRHDQCCATHGAPLYSELAARVGDDAWQISHIGGHRLAATMMCFPHALTYGRLDANDAERIVTSYQAGRLLLDKFRARAIVPKPAQAAEYFLRQQRGWVKLDEVFMREMHDNDAQSWTVHFDTPEGPQQVRVSAAPELYLLGSTGDAQTKAFEQFQLVELTPTT